MTETASDYHRGDMDIHAQQSTFHHVMIASKWGTLAICTGVAFLALWFCTAAGFMTAFGTAVVMIALGVFFLREKKSTH